MIDKLSVPLKKRSILSVFRGLYYFFLSLFSSATTSKFRLDKFSLVFRVPRNSTFAWSLAKYKTYEPKNTNWILENIKDEQNVFFVDVGANFGWYTCILAKRFPGKIVVAIEPEPVTHTLLESNVKNNSVLNVKLFQLGIGSTEGLLKLFVSQGKNTGTHSVVQVSENTHSVDVKVVSLDHLLADIPGVIGFMKIDIEGSELDAIKGAKNTLERTKILMLEFTPNLLIRLGVKPLDLLKEIELYNYSINYISSQGDLEMVTAEYLMQESEGVDLWQKDLIFINRRFS